MAGIPQPNGWINWLRGLFNDLVAPMQGAGNLRVNVLLVTTLFGSVCLQAALNPLGGVWQQHIPRGNDTACDIYLNMTETVGMNLDHCAAGTAILAYSRYQYYAAYKFCLLLCAWMSLAVVFFLVASGGRLLRHRAGIGFLKSMTSATFFLMALSIALGMLCELPEDFFKLIWDEASFTIFLFFALGFVVMFGFLPLILSTLISLTNMP